MICITGDVHHDSLATNEQKFIAPESEVRIAAEYVKLLERCGVKATLYITGKCFTEQPEDVKPIIASPAVEIGGHTYGALPLPFFEQLKYRLRGLTPPSHAAAYGSERQQRSDIGKNLAAVRKYAGREVLSWRSHGYVHDDTTYRLLFEMGVRNVSDDIRRDVVMPYETAGGLYCHPINVIPDHDHIYHVHRTTKFVEDAKKRGYGADEFGMDSYEITEWGDRVMAQADEVEKRGGVATLLMHPVCMYASDHFHTAERILRYLSRYETVWACEIRDRLGAKG